MACFHPMKGFIIGKTESGKRSLKMVPYSCNHVEEDKNGTFYGVVSQYRSDRAKRCYYDWIQIPCGHCEGCRMANAKQWADRCMLELGYHDNSYFVTLTYDDDHVPMSAYGDLDTGEAHPCMTLRKRDLQLFMKRLRKRFGEGIRFFACGEYGGKTLRPHYHLVLFGMPVLPDLVQYKEVSKGDFSYSYYNSELLSSVWQQGFVVIGKVTYETCAYTARYVLKKAKVSRSDYEEMNIEPEFVVMSRRPGIAHQYFVDHPDMYQFDHIIIPGSNGGRFAFPPAYFDRLFDVDHHDELELVKERRRLIASESVKSQLQRTSLDYESLLLVKEESYRHVVNALPRLDI